jgi:hypothetical protein
MLSISMEMRRRVASLIAVTPITKSKASYASMRHQPGRRTPLVKMVGSGSGNGAMHVYVEGFQIDAAHERVFPPDNRVQIKLLTGSLLLDWRCYTFSRIGDLGSVHLPPGSKRVKPRASGACDFPHFNTSCQQRICNQGAMAAPGNGFGAHDCNPLPLRKLDQIVHMFSELRRLHVIGKSTETGVVPTVVNGVPPRMPEATQPGHVPVVYASGMQSNPQSAPVELWIVARTRDGAYIDQSLYIVGFKKMDEVRYRAGGVPYRHDNQGSS